MDAFYYIGAAFALGSAIAFLVFLRGFLGQMQYYFTIAGRADYLDIARTRVVWGVLLLLALFVAWELFAWVWRSITTLFGY